MYVRTEDLDKNIQVSFLTAETRVAPVKQLPMSRSELSAAQLGAILLRTMSKILNIQDIYARTDNTIVLSRVANIQEVLPRNHWDHVPSDENPAEIASRGATVT